MLNTNLLYKRLITSFAVRSLKCHSLDDGFDEVIIKAAQ
jgi:hypothetical protein